LPVTALPSAPLSVIGAVSLPPGLVVGVGCVPVVARPAAASAPGAPWMGLPNPARAVTVIVEVPPAVIGEVALTDDWAAEIAPVLTTTAAVCVIAMAFIVADTVFVPAAVALKVPVICPLASVVPTGCVIVIAACRDAA